MHTTCLSTIQQFNVKKNSPKNSSWFDLIKTKVVKYLPRRTTVFLSKFMMLCFIYHIFLYCVNNLSQYSYIVIYINYCKTTKTSSYWPIISLIPNYSKTTSPIVKDVKILPNSQFGFRNSQSTIYHVVDNVSFALEEKIYCTGAFLYVSQAFGRVWHSRILLEFKTFPS